MASLALSMGKRSVVALTPWRAATSSISRKRKGLPIGAAADGAHSRDERECVNGDGRWRNADEPERSIGAQSLEVCAPILIGVDRRKNEVERAGHFLHGFGLAAVDEVVGAEGAGFLFLGHGGGEGGHVRTEDAGELDGKVAEAADADDADAGGRIDAEGAHGVVDRDAAAEQRRGLFAGQGVGDGNDKAGVGANAVSVAAVAMDACAFRSGTEILLAAHTPLALAARVGLPAEADALANFKRTNLAAESRDGANDFVTGDEGVLADAPVVRNEMKIAVADAAVSDGDFDFVRAELARIVTKRKQL